MRSHGERILVYDGDGFNLKNQKRPNKVRLSEHPMGINTGDYP